MHLFERFVVKRENGKYLAVLLKVTPGDPCSDAVAEKEFDHEIQAIEWLNEEIGRLANSKKSL
jgi:hypothetical protein